VNVTGAVIFSVRELAEWFAERFGKPAPLMSTERADALLSNTSRMKLGKATKFQARDGRF